MEQSTHIWKTIAIFLSMVTLTVWWAARTAHTEPALKQYETNPFVFVGISAIATLLAWVVFFVRRGRTS